MHPRNPYSSPPDFQKLAEAYPSLQPHLVKTNNEDVTIDFQDGSSQRRLTEALLYRDFNLVVTIPEDRLCPTVPNRLNYILWLEDLLTSTGPLQTSSSNGPITSRQMKCRGIDIGLGASVIYPLLACRISPNWTMVGTDIDQMSLQSAKINIAKNNLTSRISVFMSEATVGATIFPSQLRDFRESGFDFTMCNPPFYSSKEDVSRSAEGKSMGPNAVCTGADVEMITPGGEAEFVRRMVQESFLLRERCRWYTSMLGKLSSLAEIVEALRANKIDNYAITEFVQGQTRRWAIGWSFGELRAPDTISRISNTTVQNLMPSRTTLYQSVYHPTSSSESAIASSSTNLRDTLQEVIRSVPELDVKAGSFVSSSDSHPPTNPVPSTSPPETVHSSTPSSLELIPPPNIATLSSASTSSDDYFLISAPRNTWSRAARRAGANSRKRKRDTTEDTDDDIRPREGGGTTDGGIRPSTSPNLSPESPILVCRVFLVDPTASRTVASSSKPPRASSQAETASRTNVDGPAERVMESEQSVKVGFEWVRGKDRAVFEGFVNHVGRKMRDAIAGRDLKAGG